MTNLSDMFHIYNPCSGYGKIRTADRSHSSKNSFECYFFLERSMVFQVTCCSQITVLADTSVESGNHPR